MEGGILKGLEMQHGKPLECCKQSLMSDSGEREDQNASWTVDSKDWTQEVSKENDSIQNWIIGHPYYIVAKKLSKFCLCPETFSEAYFKSDGLCHLAEEISRPHNIQAGSWILLVTFSLIYCGIQEQKAEQKDLKNWD